MIELMLYLMLEVMLDLFQEPCSHVDEQECRMWSRKSCMFVRAPGDRSVMQGLRDAPILGHKQLVPSTWGHDHTVPTESRLPD